MSDPIYVLVVDDQPENLISMEAVLTSPEIRLVMTRSGKEALRAVLEYDFALILMDVQMPGMDGFETAEIIRQRERSRLTPIIFVTAINKSDRNIFQGYSFGAVDYVFKPFMPEILKSKVEVFVELFRKSQTVKRRSETLEQSNRELKAFSQTMASDLLATLNRVDERMRSIRERLAASSDEGLADLLVPFDEDSLMTSRLHTCLQDYFSASNREYESGPVSLAEVCRGEVERTAGKTEAKVHWDIGSLPEVLGDIDMFRILFRNLLLNALRFTRKTAHPVIDIGSSTETKEVVVTIRDNGMGFEIGTDEQDLPGTLRQMGSKGDFEGAGISLLVALRIIRRHGGRLWVHSEPGNGSTVSFALPVAS